MTGKENEYSTETIGQGLLVVTGYTLFFVAFFSPVLFSTHFLAPGDGISYFVPQFYSRTMLWDAGIWAGFPSFGDPQRMYWYPPAILFSLIPRSWNAFIVSAYILAASFTYGYVFSLTRSRVAALVSGLIYSLSAFMISHMGHAAIVHTTAWLPLILWSYSELGDSEKFNRLWFLIAALAVACAVLAGHPQMTSYVLVVSVLYVLVRGLTSSLPVLRYYLTCGAALLLGIGISAIQVLPTMELAPHTVRAALTFNDFVAYQLPLRQLPMIVFPMLYGGAPASFYATPYFGAWPSGADGWGASELSGYVGLMPLMLAGIGFVLSRRRMAAWFWCGIALLALLLVLGEATPLASIIYELPVLNKFRAPARHFFAFDFAISILAGLGVSSFSKGTVTRRFLMKTVFTAAIMLMTCFLAVGLFSAKINEMAIQHLGYAISLNPLKNPSLLVPLLIFLGATLLLFVWRRRHISRVRIALVIFLVMIDLASCAWFYEWRYRAPYKAFLTPPAAFENYRAQLEQDHQRVLAVRGGLGRVSELPPNLSKLWNIPNASGYGPFVLTRLNRLLSMQPHGSTDDTWRESSNLSLDLLGVRYVLLPDAEGKVLSEIDQRGLHWSTSDFSHTIGQGCAPTTPQSFELELRQPERLTRLGIVGTLACSVALPSGAEFAQVTITNAYGHDEIHNLRAGEHFSEWAWDCPDVRPAIQHERAVVFSSRPVERGTTQCDAHDYVAFLPIRLIQDAKKISFRWIGPPATFAMRKITAIDDERGESVPIFPAGPQLTDTSRWKPLGQISHSNSGYDQRVNAGDVGVAHIYENLRARPRAWLVPEVIRVSEAEALDAVRTSRLPDGRSFDLSRMAVVDSSLPVLELAEPTFSGTARVTALSDDVMEVVTNSSASAFLVTSDLYYPGWKVTIDRNPTDIYQANYVIRGVVVPAGAHSVRFEFRPRSFYVGASLSGFSLLIATVFFVYRPGSAQQQRE